MLSETNATLRKVGPGSDSTLQLLIEPEPWLRIFLRNLRDSFHHEPPPPAITSAPGQYWADAQVSRPAPWTFLADSLLGHLLIVAAVYGLTLLWLNQPRTIRYEIVESQHIENYQVSEYLPSVSQQKPDPPRRSVAQKADPAYAPQEIISVHVDHQSTKQTIVNPVKPKLLAQDTPLPNIVVWTPTLAAAPVAANHPLRELPLTTPPVVPPTEQPTQRKLNALEFQIQPRVVAPPEAPANRNLAALNVPAASDAAVPPSQTAAQRRVGDINLAMSAPEIEAPKLPVPEQKAASGGESGSAKPVRVYVPPAEPVTVGTGRSEGREVGQLLVTNVQPVAPSGPMVVPEGNRQGEFAAGPTGRPGASGQPEISAGANNSNGSKAGGNPASNGVYIAPSPAKITAGVVVSAPNPPRAPVKPDTHSDNTAREVPLERVDRQVFGDRKSYPMAQNLPNLTSAAGASWIIRFAEMHPVPGTAGEGVSGPVALSKVDPAYPPDLIRDRVEGTVILYAVIHADGTVSDIRVLQSVDETLDQNARAALGKWRFQPGTKNGAPVDLEAVIRVPFRIGHRP